MTNSKYKNFFFYLYLLFAFCFKILYITLRKEPCFSADLSSACFFGEDLKRIGLREDTQKIMHILSAPTTKAIETAAFLYTFKDKKTNMPFFKNSVNI